MMREVLSHFHLPGMTCLALLLFFGVFSGMLFWVFRKQRKPFYEYMENLPLEVLND